MTGTHLVRTLAMSLALLTGCATLEECPPQQDWRATVERMLRELSLDINQSSAQWQALVEKTIEELPSEVQDTVRVELQNLLSRGISEAEVAAQCGVDFLAARMREHVQGILAEFQGRPPPDKVPRFCSVVPPIVHVKDAADTPLLFYGYDFDAATDLQVLLRETTGASTDVTSKLGKPTHYLRTLSFGPTGVQLGPRADWIVLRFGTQEHTVDVEQPTIPPCKTETVPLTDLFVEHVPPHVRGDTEFDGNGPFVHAQTRLIVTRDRVDAEVYMRAAETTSDWTTAEGKRTFRLFPTVQHPIPAGWTIAGIDNIAGIRTDEIAYNDNNHSEESFSGAGLVRSWVIMGDTAGNEAGTRTKAKISFGTLHLRRTQTEGCTPTAPLPSLPTSRPLCEWTERISEENGSGGVACSAGFAARGMQCTGRYCDDVALLCCPYAEGSSGAGESTQWSGYVSEEQSSGFAYDDKVLAGIRCKGSYCDDMSGRMLGSPTLGAISSCRWSSAFSEERPGHAICGMDELVTGLKCTGRYCDNLSLRCCRVAGADPR